MDTPNLVPLCPLANSAIPWPYPSISASTYIHLVISKHFWGPSLLFLHTQPQLQLLSGIFFDCQVICLQYLSVPLKILSVLIICHLIYGMVYQWTIRILQAGSFGSYFYS